MCTDCIQGCIWSELEDLICFGGQHAGTIVTQWTEAGDKSLARLKKLHQSSKTWPTTESTVISFTTRDSHPRKQETAGFPRETGAQREEALLCICLVGSWPHLQTILFCWRQGGGLQAWIIAGRIFCWRCCEIPNQLRCLCFPVCAAMKFRATALL